MTTKDISIRGHSSANSVDEEPEALPWYAIRVRSNFEQTVSNGLRGKGYEAYLPMYRKLSRSRAKLIELPLFPGYVFSRVDVTKRVPVLSTPGVVTIVGFGGSYTSVPDTEIEAVRTVINSGMPSAPCFLPQEGDTIRITRGALSGVEGILLRNKSAFHVVVSIRLLQRSISVELDRESIEAISAVSPYQELPSDEPLRLRASESAL